MARVVINSGNSHLPRFGPQTNASAVKETEAGLTWTSKTVSPAAVSNLVFTTVGGSIDPETQKPAGSATGFTVSLPDGTVLFTVENVNVAISDMLKGVNESASAGSFWTRLLDTRDVVFGAAAGESLNGYDGDDRLWAQGGDDTLTGGEGSDLLSGGLGFDTVDFSDQRTDDNSINLSTKKATFGDDTDTLRSIENVRGTDKADQIIGSQTGNRLEGNGGNDEIYGGRGADTLDGGAGADVIQGGDHNDSLIGGKGDDYLSGEDGDDRLSGGENDDKLYGGGSDDVLIGGSGDDVLDGGAGHDRLNGGAGKNGLNGGVGNDTFYFGTGEDYVTLGRGADVLVLNEVAGSAQVGDFRVGVDNVVLDVAGANPPSVQKLIDDGRFTVSGASSYTLLSFGETEIVLLGVDSSKFSLVDVSVI